MMRWLVSGGGEEDHKKMHWWAWWKMCIPKKNGGMGFKDLHAFNLAISETELEVDH